MEVALTRRASVFMLMKIVIPACRRCVAFGKSKSVFFFILIRLLGEIQTRHLFFRLQKLSPNSLLRGALASNDPLSLCAVDSQNSHCTSPSITVMDGRPSGRLSCNGLWVDGLVPQKVEAFTKATRLNHRHLSRTIKSARRYLLITGVGVEKLSDWTNLVRAGVGVTSCFSLS